MNYCSKGLTDIVTDIFLLINKDHEGKLGSKQRPVSIVFGQFPHAASLIISEGVE